MTLDIATELAEELREWGKAEFRSREKQIEALLTAAVAERRAKRQGAA